MRGLLLGVSGASRKNGEFLVILGQNCLSGLFFKSFFRQQRLKRSKVGHFGQKGLCCVFFSSFYGGGGRFGQNWSKLAILFGHLREGWTTSDVDPILGLWGDLKSFSSIFGDFRSYRTPLVVSKSKNLAAETSIFAIWRRVSFFKRKIFSRFFAREIFEFFGLTVSRFFRAREIFLNFLIFTFYLIFIFNFSSTHSNFSLSLLYIYIYIFIYIYKMVRTNRAGRKARFSQTNPKF